MLPFSLLFFLFSLCMSAPKGFDGNPLESIVTAEFEGGDGGSPKNNSGFKFYICAVTLLLNYQFTIKTHSFIYL
ncbi:hypothetical protein HanXRQr2_Chr05g0200221 [Helianthus annuus]|uniref:Uncharacterized protein n=1 Tax=Helianthus annuus TaxID=4232 RepID=A0A9K3IX27_HELAN|nr:hypothetical protein HanXRQr2_Chr05g0200221 [Helianthus annuus]